MLAKNNTPFAAIAFEQIHRDGLPMAVITCRATYDLSEDGELTLANKQDLVLSDEYEGDPLKTALLKASDLVPFKPNTDITVIGTTYAPEGKRSVGWEFGLEIDGHVRVYRCHGLRNWIPDGKKDAKPSWKMSETKPIDFAPIDYRYAAGSSYLNKPDNNPNGLNPIGAPLIDPAYTPEDAVVPVAMIDSEKSPITSSFVPTLPQGLGPVPPFWHQRARFVGTTDKAWEEQRFPQLPKDFNYLHYQYASNGMMWPGFMRGNETFTLYCMRQGGEPLSFQLPSLQPFAVFDWIDERQATAKLNLDGVHIDMRSKQASWQVDLTWRGWVAICPQFFKIDLFMAELGAPELNELLCSNENGLYDPATSHGTEEAQ